MVVNSSYGKCGLNKEKQRDYSYYSANKIFKPIPNGTDDSLRQLRKTGQKIKEDPFTVSMDEVVGEYPTNQIEFVKRKRSYQDTTCIHFSHFILSSAKLKMLMFIDHIIDNWKTESLRLLYTGTLLLKRHQNSSFFKIRTPFFSP